MDDLITRAQAKREWHLTQAAKLETFLATYFDLEQELKIKPPADEKTDAEKAEAPKRQREPVRPSSGVGAETINAAEELVRQHGPLSAREMLPMLLARGVDIGGKKPLSTLSARLSGRGELVAHDGKWYLKGKLPWNNKEEADNPAKDTSASSLFSSQGGRDGPALTN